MAGSGREWAPAGWIPISPSFVITKRSPSVFINSMGATPIQAQEQPPLHSATLNIIFLFLSLSFFFCGGVWGRYLGYFFSLALCSHTAQKKSWHSFWGGTEVWHGSHAWTEPDLLGKSGCFSAVLWKTGWRATTKSGFHWLRTKQKPCSLNYILSCSFFCAAFSFRAVCPKRKAQKTVKVSGLDKFTQISF